MTKRLQTLLGQIALDDTQRTRVREEALACVEWLRESERDTQEDADTWTYLIEGLKDIPLVSPHYERVREFMERAGQATPLEYTPLDEPTRILRAELILEEALETINALGIRLKNKDTHKTIGLGNEEVSIYDYADNILPVNIESVIDGLTDLSVVTIGTFIALGLPDVPFLQETDRANLEKFEVPKCRLCNRDMRHSDISGEIEWVCPKHHEKEHYSNPIARPLPLEYHTPPAHTQIAHSLGINLTTNEVP